MSARLVNYFALAMLLTGTIAQGANTPGNLDFPPSNIVPAPVDMLDNAVRPPERVREPEGNPLWSMPLASFTATRERPLFVPSRRGAAPAVAAVPAAAPPPRPPPPAEPENPPLVLVGAIASDTEGFAVFVDQSNNAVVRLRIGQDHLGWVLRGVKGREATLEKNQRTATLSLPVPGIPAGAVPIPNALPHLPNGEPEL